MLDKFEANTADQQGPPIKDTRHTPRGGHNREKKPRKNPSGRSSSSNGARRNQSKKALRRRTFVEEDCVETPLEVV